MQPSVELVGLEQVVEYIDNCLTAGYEYYIVYQGAKNVKFQYNGDDIGGEGVEALKMALKVPASNGTSAIYTLAFFSKLKQDGEIDKSSQIASVNFRLNEPNAMFNRSQIGSVNDTVLLQQIEALKQRVDDLQAVGDVEDAEPVVSPFMQIITGLLSHPVVQEKIVNKAMGFIDTILPDKKAIAGMEKVELSLNDERLKNAINVLLNSDKEFVNNMEALARLAVEKPAIYAMAVSQLKNL